MRRLTLAGSILVALGAFFASGIPVFGDTGGTVPATVTVPAAVCVTVDTTPISYGTLPFSPDGSASVSNRSVGGVTSCSTVNQDLAVAGANATGNLGASWDLVAAGSCPGMGIDKFKHVIQDPDSSFLGLTTTGQILTLLSPSEVIGSLTTDFIMPCQGSEGAGQTMSTSIIFTATIVP